MQSISISLRISCLFFTLQELDGLLNSLVPASGKKNADECGLSGSCMVRKFIFLNFTLHV